jgi:hypothetical protein
MSQAIAITPEVTRVIREGRQANPPRTWRDLSEELGISLKAAIDIAKRVGLYQPSYRQRINNSPPAPPAAALSFADADLEQPFFDDDLGRKPLPPGDPTSWGAIIAGTCLEGVPYLQDH